MADMSKLPNETKWEYVKRMHTDNTTTAIVVDVLILSVVGGLIYGAVVWIKKLRKGKR